ncbi:MAG TPA: hypothetical protein PKI19_08450 [Elusimicrobiales bacterium]|nr:hypothetical protein [Elusimicrobiales bacterium]
MDYLNILEEVIERPEALAAAEAPAELGRAGLAGYALGTLGIFTFLRLQSAVPPGVMSFLMVLFFVLAGNLLLAAITHLFMDLTDARGSAARLFLAFGYTDYFFTLLVPAGFFVRLGYLGAFFSCCLCLAIVLYARIGLVRKLYPVSANKAALSVGVPYAGFFTLGMFAFVYGLAWLIWLLI